MKKLFALIWNRWLLAVLGLTAFALLIWFVGPLIAIAEYRPLESEAVRAAVIGLLLLFALARLLWRHLRSRRANANLMDGLLRQNAPEAPGRDPLADHEIAALRKRFEEAVGALKTARIGQGGRSRTGIFGGLGRQWVYELPWYVFIGAPGSGKTTALVNSGLRFPLAGRTGEGAPRGIGGVGGTRNCEWWFTNEAVLLDTAGRYTTQESNQAVDSAAWSGFLQLLKKYRARRPINGVLLTISVPDLLEQNAAQRETHLQALRNRIDELHRELGIRFPLYVLVTKMDLLAGFMEFFGEFGKEEREQVWGASFPYAEKAAPLETVSFATEFAALEQRINDRLLDRLQQERDPQKRAQLYLFPQQLSLLGAALEEFIGGLFAPSQFSETPLVRGVYFTSGTQEGNPIDRVMGTLGRALRLDTHLVPPQRAGGKSFFLTRLLRDVVFQEAGLAGANLRGERRRALLHGAALTMAVLIACAVIAAWAVSYFQNRRYVAETEARRAATEKLVEGWRAQRGPDLVSLLPALDAVQRIAAHPEQAEAPWSMGLGLYQGEKLAAATRIAYRRLLQEAFLPRLAMQIEQPLRAGARGNPELLYESLKAYLMLHDPRHRDAAALKAYLAADWENSLPREVTQAQRKALERHASALFDGDAMAAAAPVVPAVPPDARLIAEVRQAIAGTPLAGRVYHRLRRQDVAAGMPEFTVARAAGPAAALAFIRASGKPLTSGVPGLYSFNGYHQAFLAASERVTQQLAAEEPWVLGTQSMPDNGSALGALRLADPAARNRVLEEVRRLYLEDYARIWEEFISDIRLVRPASLQQSIELARILSAPDSPLPPLLRGIVREVTLTPAEEKDRSAVEKAGDKVRSAKEDLLKLFGQQKPAGNAGMETAAALARPESIVDQRFDNLRRLVRAQPGAPAPIDGTIGLLNELYTLLIATEAAVKGGNTPPPSEVPNRIRAESGRLPEPVRSMLMTLSGGGATQVMGATRANLGQSMRASVTEFCNKAIAGRYPFVRSSRRDVTQEDFARLFAAGGVLDEFFQKNLAPYVNTATRPWSFRELGDASLGAGSAALVQFQRAQTIRDVFFRGAQGPAMRLEFRPQGMDPALAQFILDVDGQEVKYSHGPLTPVQVQWPGPRGGAEVRLQASTVSGTFAPAQSFDGPWALFRLFDHAQIEATGQPERFIATFTVDGRKARFDVFTGSVQNPFRLRELEQFQCPSQL